jgi:ABC-type transport system involved in Fe-S cluster assembly fused permease/ATPase subunit
MIWEAGLFILLRFISSFDYFQTKAANRISQYSSNRIKGAAYEHVMGLTTDFHNSKDSGELMKAIDQAGDLTKLLEVTVFITGPMVLDLLIGVVYFSYTLDVYIGLDITIVVVLYIFITLRGNSWMSALRRDFTEKERDESRILHESIQNWMTVTLFNQKTYEEDRFSNARRDCLNAERRLLDVNSLVQVVLTIIKQLGLMVAAFFVVYRIAHSTSSTGSFVTLLTYWSSITKPLSVLANSYCICTTYLIRAERLLELLHTQPTIDDTGCDQLYISDGRVEFDKVSFSYDDRKSTLKTVDVTAKSGQTVAFVGATGSGKSTIFRLLLRLYDVTKGAIKIDGQDLRCITLKSLRDSIGVVPQESLLFNETIMYNVKYARTDATVQEVEEACRQAAIHETIMSFPDGYQTMVGERGVKLSGGEIQRISIARVILRMSPIVLLDEATSAVDSSTEAKIQEALKNLSAGRTIFIIAHRLSTIMDSDLILVVDDGKIVERGNHYELLQLGGTYNELWSKQSQSSGNGKGKNYTNCDQKAV